MEGKVAVLGDADFVMPFKALGLDTFGVGEKSGDIGENAAKIIEGGYALVDVAENIAPAAEAALASCQNLPVPCVVVVPFTTESKGHSTRVLGELLRMSTGINILQND